MATFSGNGITATNQQMHGQENAADQEHLIEVLLGLDNNDEPNGVTSVPVDTDEAEESKSAQSGSMQDFEPIPINEIRRKSY